MKLYILDSNRNHRFALTTNILLGGDVTMDLNKLNTVKIKLSRDVNSVVYDYVVYTDNIGFEIVDGTTVLRFVKGNAETTSDSQGICDVTFFGEFYDITYKKVNYSNINLLVNSSVQNILQNLDPSYNYQYVGANPPSVEINIGAMDNLNLFNEVMKRASCQWRELGLVNNQPVIQYGDMDYIVPKLAVYGYIKIDNYWNNNKVKIKSWKVKENNFRYDYVRFFVDKGSGTDGATTFDNTVTADQAYPVVNIGQEYWVQNTTVAPTNPKWVTKVINIPDSDNLPIQSVKQILYENAISYFQSTQDDDEIEVTLQTRKILLAGDKLLVVIKQNGTQKRFMGTLRNIKYNLITQECSCQLVANPRKDLRNKNLALLKNISKETYQKKYTPN
jgi:hypothetical protein